VGQLISAMENSVSREPGTDGRFPQIAGMVMEADFSKPAIEGSTENVFQARPSRVKSLIVTGRNGTSVDTVVSNFTAVGDLSRTFVLATNNFLFSGGDAYFTFAEATLLGELELGEHKLFEEYIMDELDEFVDIPDPPPRPVRLNLIQ
jgi:hypothetical protein